MWADGCCYRDPRSGGARRSLQNLACGACQYLLLGLRRNSPSLVAARSRACIRADLVSWGRREDVTSGPGVRLDIGASERRLARHGVDHVSCHATRIAVARPLFSGRPGAIGISPATALVVSEQAAAKFGTRIACRYGHQELSYAELWEAVRRVAAGLAARGLKPGDRVGILLPNCPEYLISVYGVWLAGGVVVSLSPFMVADEVSSLLDLTDCQSLIAIDLLAPLCRHATAPQHTFLVSLEDRLPYWERLGYRVKRVQRGGRGSRGGAGCSRFAELLNGEALPLPIEHEPIDVPAYVLCTGGTTGAPKAVVLTHRNLVANAWQIAHWVGRRTGQETILAVIPFFHSYGLTTCVVGGVAMAATLILDHRFQPRRVVELVEQHRPTLFYAVPTMLAMLNKHLREHPADVRSLKWCVSGGSALDPPIAEEFAKHSGALVIEGYGLSEAGPVTHVNPLDETARAGGLDCLCRIRKRGSRT